jgi:hypothetical protein
MLCSGLPVQGAAAQAATQRAASANDVAHAAYAGWTTGASKSTALVTFGSGSLSFVAPPTGFLFLLFLHTSEVQPNFAEQAFLRDKSPEYTRTWVENYDRALTQKQRRSIIVASTVGTVAGYFLIYKPLFAKPAY